MTTQAINASRFSFLFPKGRIFWIFNLLGWATYIMSNVLLMWNRQEWFAYSILLTSLRVAGMFSFCVLFRALFIRYKWHSLPISQFMLLALVYSLFASAVSCVFAMFVNIHLATYSVSEAIYEAVFSPVNWDNQTIELLWASLSCLFILLTWTIGYGLINLYNRNKNTEIENLKLHNSLRGAEMDSLKAQINPHFLLNTLNNLRSMIRKQHPESVNIVTAISEVLKYSLIHQKSDKVTLSHELEIVQNMIAIASLQFGARLRFDSDVESGLDNAMVPPFAIQLLIENAIKHGIEKRKEGGVVQLRVFANEDALHIRVVNSGALDGAEPSSTGMGLINLRKRLDILYPEQATFTLKQEELVIAELIQPKEFAL